MKRLKRVTTRLLAIMLTGAMMIGNPSLSVLAAEDDQGTAEVIVEESEEEAAGDPYNTGVTEDSVTEDSSEEMEKEAAAEGTSVERGSEPEYASEAAEGEADSSVGEAPDHAIEDGAASYVVTLDANGGHFENERDDILGEILETAEILTRIIPAGEAVRSIPVYGKTAEDGQKGTFLGWSLEKNSEAAVKEDYVPVRDCTLFAVWDVEEGLSEENSSEGNSSEENSSEGNSSEENSSAEVIPEEIDDAEESAGETATVPEENIAAEDANDGVARAEESEISLPDGGKNGGLEEENVSSPPSYGKVTGISAKANVAATVKNYEVSKTVKATLKNGVLTVSGSGAIPNYDYSNSPKWLDEISEIKKVIIGTGITRIGDWAFMDTVNLESVSWGSVTSIGEAAFCRSGLKSVTIPDRVTTIGMFAFEECPNLTSVVIGNGVKEIPYDCFYSCEALTSVTFGSGVQKIDNLAFAYCGIETLTLPANIKELGVGTFGECRKLKKVTTKGLIHVAYQAFFNDTALTSVTLNEGIEYIYKLAFYGCSSLSSVTIPKSVREIVDEAFPANTVIINKNKNLERVGTNGYRVDECLYINGTEDYSKAYEVLNLVNKERKAAGLETLKMDGSLLKTAMLRAAEITLYFSHTRPDGTDCFTANSKMFGENIAAGAATAKDVMEIWMDSKPHKENILGGDFKTIGVGCFSYKGFHYWVQCFGTDSISSNAARPSNKNVNAKIYIPKKQVGDDSDFQKANPFVIFHGNSTGNVKETVGKTFQLSLSCAGRTFVSNKVYWKSSNAKVATVDANGKLKIIGIGTCTITASSKTIKRASITVAGILAKPGNCRFNKWNNAKYSSCQIAWNKVGGADGYQSLLTWTDGSHAKTTNLKANVLSQNCSVAVNHVSQFKVRAYKNTANGKIYGRWSNVTYITPSPTSFKYQKSGSSSKPAAKVSWNIIYGCNGYNVFVTTNPNGKWYWNQSSPEKAVATSATIKKYRGEKLKKGTTYYVRIVTRRKRNGVFCTVPMPANNTYIGSFVIK